MTDTSHVLRLDVAYDGTQLHGWQQMPGVRTVQGCLQDAAATLMRRPVEVHAAGRTDAGVHALGQVCSVDVETAPSPDELRRWLRGFNALLPADVVVNRLSLAPRPGWHARQDAIGKRYVYRIHNAPVRALFTAAQTWHVTRPLNVAAMQDAAYALLGEQDFESFRAAGCQARHAIRYLWRARVWREADEVLVELRGNAFVRNQVRIAVGTLVDVGLGSRPVTDVARILAARDRTLAGRTAPPQGLRLDRVYYTEDALDADIPAEARFPGWPDEKSASPRADAAASSFPDADG